MTFQFYFQEESLSIHRSPSSLSLCHMHALKFFIANMMLDSSQAHIIILPLHEILKIEVALIFGDPFRQKKFVKKWLTIVSWGIGHLILSYTLDMIKPMYLKPILISQ